MRGARAGSARACRLWIPAFAGMTGNAHSGRLAWSRSRALPTIAFPSATSPRARDFTPRSSAAAIWRRYGTAVCPISMRPGPGLILVEREPPINPVLYDHGGVHHSFIVAHDDYQAALDGLRARGVEITFEEDRQGGVVNGPRAYFHDPDGTVLEFIDLTSYAGSKE